MISKYLIVYTALAFAVTTEAFVTQKKLNTFVVVSRTEIRDVKDVPKDSGSGISYSERSRPYRRDVFTQEDWVRHRSSDRFVGNLVKLTRSGVVRSLFQEMGLIASTATFICVVNAFFAVGFTDFAGVHHEPLLSGFPVLQLPAAFFTLSSPALSLLLGAFVG